MNGVFDETKCTKGASIKAQWSAEEARLVKRILNNLSVRQWDHSYTEIEREPSGDWIIWIPFGNASGASASSEYASFFKVYDASAGGACKIGVKDGSAVDPLVGKCGYVWANGDRYGVDAYESVAIEAAGSIWVWRVDEVGAEGFDTYVETTTSSTPPTGGGFAYRTRLLGRAEIVSDGAGGHVVSAINQDYLKGGDDEVYLWWDCDIPEQEPEA